MSRGLLWASIATVVALLLSCVSLGIPGAVLYELARPITRLVKGSAVPSSELGDRAWPLAIVIALFWPFGILLGYLIAYRLVPLATGRPLVLLAVLACWSLGVAVVFSPAR